MVTDSREAQGHVWPRSRGEPGEQPEEVNTLPSRPQGSQLSLCFSRCPGPAKVTPLDSLC